MLLFAEALLVVEKLEGLEELVHHREALVLLLHLLRWASCGYLLGLRLRLRLTTSGRLRLAFRLCHFALG